MCGNRKAVASVISTSNCAVCDGREEETEFEKAKQGTLSNNLEPNQECSKAINPIMGGGENLPDLL